MPVMQIGNLSLPSNILLAPMAGVTDLPFRLLQREYGCSFAFTEMISATGLIRKSENSLRYLQTSVLDRPLGVQLFGVEPAILAEAARMACDAGADVLDINMGCPVKKVVKTGAGAALLKNPLQIAEIIETVRNVVAVPLTVKIRSGWRAGEIKALEIARIAADCGADAIIIHPRTADQGFGGRADWEIIKALKESVAIPVIGNGDVRDAAAAQRIVKMTGCDGVMIARGVLGNPWLFGEITARLAGGQLPQAPKPKDIKKAIVRHLEMELDHYGEQRGSRKFVKHLLWYTKGLPGGVRFRRLAGAFDGKEAILQALHTFFH